MLVESPNNLSIINQTGITTQDRNYNTQQINVKKQSHQTVEWYFNRDQSKQDMSIQQIIAKKNGLIFLKKRRKEKHSRQQDDRKPLKDVNNTNNKNQRGVNDQHKVRICGVENMT